MVKKVISLLIIFFVIMFGCEDVDRIWDNPYDPRSDRSTWTPDNLTIDQISDNVIEGQTSGATAKIVDVTDVEVNGVNYKDLRVISIVNGPGLSDRNNGVTPVVGSDMTNIAGGMVSGIMGGLIDGEGITCSGSTATLISLTAGEMKKYTGDIIYIENRSPVARAADQTEDIKLIIEF